jgi:hypothetical protein
MSGLLNKLTHRHQTAQPGLNTSAGMQTGLTGQTIVDQPAVTHSLAPIVQETVRQDRVVEVQPVVHREVDKNIVHHIEKHIVETAPSQSGIIERQPIIEQQLHTNVINEIQPIIHRERAVPIVERTEQHLSQRVVEPTIHTHEVIYERPTMMQGQQYMGQQSWGNYQGLGFPYSGASAHPTYGYQKLSHNQKAERFELKAAEWERRGNLAKAQKNREKAQRYRARTQPGWVAPTRNQDYYVNRANLFDQKAQRYQQWGMMPQAQRYQGRSQRLRTKHNIPMQQGGFNQPLYSANQGIQQPGLMNQGLQQPGLMNQGLQQPGLMNQGLQQPGLMNQGLQQPGLLNQGLQQAGLNQGLSKEQQAAQFAANQLTQQGVPRGSSAR